MFHKNINPVGGQKPKVPFQKEILQHKLSFIKLQRYYSGCNKCPIHRKLHFALGSYETPKSVSHATEVLRKPDFIRSSVLGSYTDVVGVSVWKWKHYSSSWVINFAVLLPLLWWKLRRELADISTILQFHPVSFLPWEMCGLNFHCSKPQVIYISVNGCRYYLGAVYTNLESLQIQRPNICKSTENESQELFLCL